MKRPDRAPDAITDAQIVDILFSGLADGTLPKPAAGNLGDVLYMFWFSHTVITAGSQKSCVDFGGYHNSARRNGVEVVYAVVAECDGLDTRIVASHELIEAATDPMPSNHPGYQLTDETSPWLALGEEVGDLCERSDATGTWNDGSNAAQRIWSNTAAAAGQDPCIPHIGTPPYNMRPGIRTVPRIRPGEHQSIPLTGWLPQADRLAPPGRRWTRMAARGRPGEGVRRVAHASARYHDGERVYDHHARCRRGSDRNAWDHAAVLRLLVQVE